MKAEMYRAFVGRNGLSIDWGELVQTPADFVKSIVKNMGVKPLTAMAIRQSVAWQTKRATQEAWEALGEFANALDVATKSFVQQGGLDKVSAKRLESVLQWDEANPPKSPFINTFLHPAERRVKYSMSALEASAETSMPVKSLGEHISDNPHGRDVLLQKANATWDKIDKVRSLVLSSMENWRQDGKEIDEESAWTLLAPEAMQLAKRFMLLADHPWSRTVAYGKEGTVFYHALRREAWVKEALNKSRSWFGENQLTVDAFQSTTNKESVDKWFEKTQDMKTIRQIGIVEVFKKDNNAWRDPFGVAMALIKSGFTDSATLWLDSVIDQKSADGGSFNINTQHPELGNKTLMDVAVESSPKDVRKAIVQKLKDRGAAINSLSRTDESDYKLLMNETSVASKKEAMEWVMWMKRNSLTPIATFNKEGKKDAVVALEQGKIEWATALLGLRKSATEAMTIDGRDWAEVWKDFKVDFPEKTAKWARESKDVVDALNAAAPGDTMSLIERQEPDFWYKIDNHLNTVGSAAQVKPVKLKK